MSDSTKKVQLDLPRGSDFKRDLKLMATHKGFDSPKAMMEDLVTKSLEGWREEMTGDENCGFLNFIGKTAKT